MKRAFRRVWSVASAVALTAGFLAVSVGTLSSTPAGADTDPTTLIGQGGSFLEPVVSKLLADDSANLNPLAGSYLLTDDLSGVTAFVGSGPGQFSADFTVTERPLTSAEAATAAANGRTYAYVPFAATPVAIATLVPTFNWGGATTITTNDFCQHIPLSATLLGQIFGLDNAAPLHYWNDARIDCPESGGGNAAANTPIVAWANLDPSMANYALMALLDSSATSKADFDNALSQSGSLTTSDAPSESWPFAGNTVPGGDQPLIGKLLGINSETNAPGNLSGNWQLGATAPISSVWTGAPLGVPWNLATAAVENAATDDVAPSEAAAAAAEADATLATTSDPATNNLVTFDGNNTSDAASYNSYLMEESYLVVPTTGLSAAKATAMAQVIRFVLGSQGQQVIENFGAAPATAAMQSTGLKVASELSAEAAAAGSTSSSSTTTTTGSTATTSSTGTTAANGADGSAAAATSGSGASSSGGTGSDGSASGGLAFTGSSHLGLWVGAGALFLIAGTLVRVRLRRKEARP